MYKDRNVLMPKISYYDVISTVFDCFKWNPSTLVLMKE